MKKYIFNLILISLLSVSLQVQAIDYELPDMNGQMQSLDQYKGKWLIVNYWATWCSTCIKELPDLISLYNDNKDKDITVVGINFESITLKKLKNFVEKASIPFDVLHSEPVKDTPLGPVPALPTTYIINPDGKVVAGEIGIVTKKNIEHYIAQKKEVIRGKQPINISHSDE
ncbi:MAG: TlpA family protein disulfide reductase [Gammaproteobacteria bacterium]|nr:TlpA family protein disulfide reductase [Gammaproteobacteria bacterium]